MVVSNRGYVPLWLYDTVVVNDRAHGVINPFSLWSCYHKVVLHTVVKSPRGCQYVVKSQHGFHVKRGYITSHGSHSVNLSGHQLTDVHVYMYSRR